MGWNSLEVFKSALLVDLVTAVGDVHLERSRGKLSDETRHRGRQDAVGLPQCLELTHKPSGKTGFFVCIFFTHSFKNSQKSKCSSIFVLNYFIDNPDHVTGTVCLFQLHLQIKVAL